MSHELHAVRLAKLALLRFLLAHTAQFQALMQIAQEGLTSFQDGDYAGGWSAIKQAGDILTSLIEDWNSSQLAHTAAVASHLLTGSDADYQLAMTAQCEVAAIDPAKWANLLEFLIKYLPVILSLFGVKDK